MPRILEELYYGNINPNAKQFIRNTNFDRAMRTISDSEAKLTELLTGKEKELLLKMVNAFSEVDGTGNVEHFIEGFRLGARIIIDVMRDNAIQSAQQRAAQVMDDVLLVNISDKKVNITSG